jgi:hypothetical protein
VLAALVLGPIAEGVGPPVSHGAVDALDVTVGLRTVRAGPLRFDGEGFAGIPPQVRPVGAAVVREQSLDGNAAIGEPLDGTAQDAGGGAGGLVVVDLGVD